MLNLTDGQQRWLTHPFRRTANGREGWKADISPSQQPIKKDRALATKESRRPINDHVERDRPAATRDMIEYDGTGA
jgi:hypothetical protein